MRRMRGPDGPASLATVAGAPSQDGGRSRIIDAHHHLQDLHAHVYPWLAVDSRPPDVFGDTVASLRADYLIDDLLDDMHMLDVVKSVHVENGRDPADAVEETRWLQAIADQHGFPHGIVAHVALEAETAPAVLEAHRACPNMRGVRQILNWDPDPSLRFVEQSDLMGDPAWRRGFALLGPHGLSFDLQIYPHQFAAALDLARSFPDTQIVLDHIGMPIRRSAEHLAFWRAELRSLARAENVAVKLSGFALGPGIWSEEAARTLMSATIDCFGPDRCMFASNFPVDALFISYEALVASFRTMTAGYSPADRDALFYQTANRVYRL